MVFTYLPLLKAIIREWMYTATVFPKDYSVNHPWGFGILMPPA